MIPCLLTQTWRSLDLPPAAVKFRHGWRTLNPAFECRLFDDAMCRSVIADVAPGLLSAYDSLPHPVMRADVFRYAVIYRDGGVYADIDMECLKPLEAFLDTECLLVVEARLGAARTRELGYRAPFQIANCIFAAAPGHPFLLAALRRAFEMFHRAPKVGLADVEDVTGPRMLTRLFFEREWSGVSLASQIALMAPLHYPNLWPCNVNMYARHHTFGSWKLPGRKSISRLCIERDRMVNPFPAVIVQPAVHVLGRYWPEAMEGACSAA